MAILNPAAMKKQVISLVFISLMGLIFTLSPLQGFSATIYVNANAAGANDGSSWADAFISLTDALTVSMPGDEIWVARGVYKPEQLLDLNGSGGTDPREAVFFLPSGVALYGGFNGTENTKEERDWVANLTILSGDIDNNDINDDGNFIAETTADIVGDNAYHVIYTENADASTRLDGFIVTAGKADIAVPLNPSDPHLDGGGWYNRLSAPTYASSPSIVNTSFYGNYAASEGGAFYTSPGPAGGESSPLIENCLFSNNMADFAGGAIYIGSFSAGNYHPVILNSKFIENEAYRRGGAIYLLGDHSQIESSLFKNNKVTAVSEDMSTLPGSGGGVSLVASNAVFNSCIFEGNTSTGNPTGAFEGGGGGAAYASTNEPQTATLGASEPQFINCGFYGNEASGNTAAWGGAMVNLNDGGILRPRYINCVFAGNSAQNDGGAVANFTRVIDDPDGFIPKLNPEFTNCTFFQNDAGQRGGGIYYMGYLYNGTQVLEAAIENSILWANTAGADGAQIYSTGTNLISYSLVQGSGGSGGGWDASLGTDGGNNIDANPGFVDETDPYGPDNIPATDDDGLRLTQFSPAVNAGNNSAAGLTGITTDYAGNPRILGGTVDMGAYERAGITLPNLDFFWLGDWPGVEPPCFTCPVPWSFLLFADFDLDPQYIWDGPGRFAKNEDIAVITGEIVNYSEPGIRFKVYLKLVRPHDWKHWSRRQGSYFAETDESRLVAADEHENWMFWTLSNDSYMEGTGDIRGKLKIIQWASSDKTGFQMGAGANAWDGDFGIGGFFVYNGKLSYKNKRTQVRGKGSMNVDAAPCEMDCEELFAELLEDNKKLKHASIELETPESQFSVYPVPAGEFLVIETNSPVKQNLTIQVVDMSGRQRSAGEWKNTDGKKVISLSGIQPGVYVLKLISTDTGNAVFQRFVKNE
jgi:hypothetical protein